MISGASEEELDIAIARADLLLEIKDLQQKIDELEYQKDMALWLIGEYENRSPNNEILDVVISIKNLLNLKRGGSNG